MRVNSFFTAAGLRLTIVAISRVLSPAAKRRASNSRFAGSSRARCLCNCSTLSMRRIFASGPSSRNGCAFCGIDPRGSHCPDADRHQSGYCGQSGKARPRTAAHSGDTLAGHRRPAKRPAEPGQPRPHRWQGGRADRRKYGPGGAGTVPQRQSGPSCALSIKSASALA